jgi:hypothetical protein
VSQQVLHLDFIGLRPETTQEQRTQLEEAAAGLLALDQVLGAGVISGESGSDFDIAFLFLLPDFTDLEPFGTDPRYVRFLQGNVAPVLRAFAGADVKLEEDLDIVDGPAACLALMAPEETYDWEVRDALETWAGALSPDACAIGIAVGERQQYRGVSIAFGGGAPTAAKPDEGPFRPALIRGTSRRLG